MLTIGKVSAQTGCNIETIRYYEKEGLMPAPDRTPGGHRQYSDVLVDRLRFIRRCRELGFSTLDTRQLLSLVDGQEVTRDRVKHIVDEHLNETRAKNHRPTKDGTDSERTLDQLYRWRCPRLSNHRNASIKLMVLVQQLISVEEL